MFTFFRSNLSEYFTFQLSDFVNYGQLWLLLLLAERFSKNSLHFW